jgi:hypothetical protein
MITVEKILEVAASAGYQFLGGVSSSRGGYALAHLNAEQPIAICKTLDEALEFLLAHSQNNS